jgi:deoxyribose-phosphate aldolase
MMTGNPGEIAKMIDISAVRADSTLDEVQQAAELAIAFGCAAVFALPAHTSRVVDLLVGQPVLTGGVVGFPGGAETSRIKAMTAAELVRMGCGEIDMVNNIAWLKAGEREPYVADVRGVVEAAEGRPVKVILECHWLSTEEIVRACQWCVEAGAAWVKTGTGWAPTGATLENVSLMKQTVGDRCGVKAAGGVRDLDTLKALYDRGARRFGISCRAVQDILHACNPSANPSATYPEPPS